MNLLVRFGYSKIMDQVSVDQSIGEASRPSPLAIGPSPWGLPATFTVQGNTFRFVETAPGDRELGGAMSLQDAAGTTLLVVGYYCYGCVLADGAILLWRESGEKAARRITFGCSSISTLEPISDPLASAAKIRRQKLGVASLPNSQRWELSPYLKEGAHELSAPYDWSRFGETLVLADHSDSTCYGKPSRAIFAFDWARRQLEVIPQDWFNNRDYDFGYQWITRVARRCDGSITGDGIRLGRFELDETNRRLKGWLVSDPFYRIDGSSL